MSNGLDGVEWLKVGQCRLDCAGENVFSGNRGFKMVGWSGGCNAQLRLTLPALTLGKNLPK